MADGESKAERLDQEPMELLQELGWSCPGSGLLAFLLTAPFQQRFASLRAASQRLLRRHRLRHPGHGAADRSIGPSPAALAGGRRSASCGSGTRWPSGARCSWPRPIVLALYVVTNVLFTSELALATAVAAVLVFAGIWYVLPMLGKPAMDDGEQPQEPGCQLPAVELEEAGLVVADLADVDLVEAGVDVLPEALQMALGVGPAGDHLGLSSVTSWEACSKWLGRASSWESWPGTRVLGHSSKAVLRAAASSLPQRTFVPPCFSPLPPCST